MKKVLVIAIVFVLILLLCSCSNYSKIENKKRNKSFEETDWIIGLSQEGFDHPFMVTQRRQILTEAEKYPNISVIATDGQNSVARQVAGIEDMIVKGIDLLMVQAAKAEGLKQKLREVNNKGIPFMFVGKPIRGTPAVTTVSMDNYRAICDVLRSRYLNRHRI